MFRKPITLAWLSAVAALVLAACQPTGSNTSSPLAEMRILGVSIQTGQGSPTPVDAFISGELPNTCAQLGEVQQQLVGQEFQITLRTTAGAGENCVQDTLPFRLALPLNTVGLAEGQYAVKVNGLETAFTVGGQQTPGMLPEPLP